MFLHHWQFFWEIRSHKFHKMTEIVYYESLIGLVCLLLARQPPVGHGLLISMFLDHIRRIAVGMTPLDEWSARRRDLYLTTHNTHYTQTSMPPSGIRTHNLSGRAVADLRLRPHGQWDRPLIGHTSNLNTKGDAGTYHSVFVPIPLLSNLESFQHRTFSRQTPTACHNLNTVYQT